jgi:hypothetical protein
MDPKEKSNPLVIGPLANYTDRASKRVIGPLANYTDRASIRVIGPLANYTDRVSKQVIGLAYCRYNATASGLTKNGPQRKGIVVPLPSDRSRNPIIPKM